MHEFLIELLLDEDALELPGSANHSDIEIDKQVLVSGDNRAVNFLSLGTLNPLPITGSFPLVPAFKVGIL